MFRREIRRDVVETAAVGGMVHETRKAHAEEAELAQVQAQQQAQVAAAPVSSAPAESAPAPAPQASRRVRGRKEEDPRVVATLWHQPVAW